MFCRVGTYDDATFKYYSLGVKFDGGWGKELTWVKFPAYQVCEVRCRGWGSLMFLINNKTVNLPNVHSESVLPPVCFSAVALASIDAIIGPCQWAAVVPGWAEVHSLASGINIAGQNLSAPSAKR